jgi:hypothetical protein
MTTCLSDVVIVRIYLTVYVTVQYARDKGVYSLQEGTLTLWGVVIFMHPPTC